MEEFFGRIANGFLPEAPEKELRFAVVPTRLVVRSDPALLERILRNLVTNALRYTSEGGVVIGARRREDHPDLLGRPAGVVAAACTTAPVGA